MYALVGSVMHTLRGAPRPPRPGMLPNRGRACGFGTMLIWPCVVMVTVVGNDDMWVADVDGVAARNYIPMAFSAALKLLPPPAPDPESRRSSTMQDFSCGDM